MSNYATRKKWPRKSRLCWACQLPQANEQLESAIERVRVDFFRASVVILLPCGETLAVEVSEHGKRLAVRGKAGSVTVAASVFWPLVEAARKADGKQTGREHGTNASINDSKANG